MDLTIERFDLSFEVREPNTRRDTPEGAPFPTDFPFVVDDDTQAVVEPLALHLASKFNCDAAYRGALWTKANSANAAAADLKAWWTFLHGHASFVAWDMVSDRTLASYIKVLQRGVSEKTGDNLDPGTVRRHCASIDAFNDFARRTWPQGTFPAMDAAKILAGFSGAQKRHATDEAPRPLSEEKVRAVNAALGPVPTIRKAKQSSRSRLAFALAVQVGLRIDEIVNLKANTFQQMKVAPEHRMKATKLRITKTKGLVARDVFFPNWLVLELQAYIAGERAESEARGLALWKGPRPENLLLNRPDARGRNPGKEATADSIEDDFNKAVVGLGYLDPKPILVGTAKETEVDRPQHVFHDGRHTYAHWTFAGLLEQGRKPEAAWLLLRNRLGHRHVKTTIDTYLKAFSEGDETVVDLLVEHLAKLAAEANP